MAERSCEPATALASLAASVFFLANRQVPKGVEHKALLLILAGYRIFRAQMERILRLLVEIRSIVVGFRNCAGCREFPTPRFFRGSALEKPGCSLIRRSLGADRCHRSWCSIAQVKRPPSRFVAASD